MVDALKDIIKTANGFVLLFNGQSERFDAKAQQMIREMEALFGNGFWDHVVLGVSFWHFDYNSIQGRNNSGKKSWFFISFLYFLTKFLQVHVSKFIYFLKFSWVETRQKQIRNNNSNHSVYVTIRYSHLSNKRGAHAYQFWKIPPSSKKNSPSSFIDFITKVSDINAEPDDNFSHDHFEL